MFLTESPQIHLFFVCDWAFIYESRQPSKRPNLPDCSVNLESSLVIQYSTRSIVHRPKYKCQCFAPVKFLGPPCECF